MKILHYTLGLPAAGTGGLPKYSFDLMCEESKLGNNITLLYPSEYTIFKKTKIISIGIENEIKIYKIVNPQLVSLNGISQPHEFYKTCINKAVYADFLRNIKPDIIHIHTLMGLHKEFLELAKEYGIKTVFTTHDYYGLCPQIYLLDYTDELCNEFIKGTKCIYCNYNSPNSKTLYIKKSGAYKKLKSTVFKILKRNEYYPLIKNGNGTQIVNDIPLNSIENIKKSEEYVTLRNFYFDILKLIDYYHFNSNIAKNQFTKYIDIQGEVISISHGGIKDMRVSKHVKKNKELRLTYLGPTRSYKGFYLLKESLEILEKNNINEWVLNVYGNNTNIELNSNKIILNGMYKSNELNKIFENTDLLIVPSIWKETFGFIALEALSYGVPIMVTDNVGMQDIIVNNITGFIVNPNSMAISELIKNLISNKDLLIEVNQNILKMDFKNTMDIHTKDIINLYIKVITSQDTSLITKV